MTARAPDPLHETRSLQTRIEILKALLELQRRQFEFLNERLYSSEPGGHAARRLLALKQSGMMGTALRARRRPE